jgi:hypothetical protein
MRSVGRLRQTKPGSGVLKNHQMAYLKGVRGGRGEQVMRVNKLPDKNCEISYFMDEIYTKKLEIFSPLWKIFTELLERSGLILELIRVEKFGL